MSMCEICCLEVCFKINYNRHKFLNCYSHKETSVYAHIVKPYINYIIYYMFTHTAYMGLVRQVTCVECLNDIHEIAEGKSCKIYYLILIYVRCIMYNFLISPTNVQYINSNVSFIRYSNMLRCIYIIFRELLFLYMLQVQNK
jgi:hypothetical protein